MSDSEGDPFNSDYEVETPQPHSNGVWLDTSKVRDTRPDPWWEATRDNKLLDMLKELPTVFKTKTSPDGELAMSDRDKELQQRRDLYMSMIKQRLSIEASNVGHEPPEKSCIHQVVRSASNTDLRITIFLLTLILEQDSSQICKSEDGIPLLHRAIAAEGERDQCKGLTSLICTLVPDPSKAIAETNDKGENCIHLLITRNIQDAKKIIGFVKPNSTPNALKQGRKDSDHPDQDGNTPLHDLLHFKNFAKKTIPCLEDLSPEPPNASHKKLCLTCLRNKQSNEKLPDMKFLAGLINALHKGAPEVLTQHNSTGRSPYSFHWATRESYAEERKAEMPKKASSTENVNGAVNKKSGLAEEINALHKGAPEVLTQHNSTGRSPYSFHWATRESYAEERKAEMPKKASHTENVNGAVNEKSGPAEEKSTTGYATKSQRSRDGKVREGQGKENDGQKERIGPQSESATGGHKDSWVYVCKNSDKTIAYLEKELYKLTADYQAITRFFFQDINKAENCNKHQGRKHYKFQPKKRVTAETTNNYDFLEFESRLALVELSLQSDSGDNISLSDQDHDHDATNLFKVFRWLKEKKKVNRILKLVIKDHPQRSCDEHTVERCLECMDEIRFLEWDKPDMSVSTIQRAKNVMDLRLHSSGINAVLCHWSDQNGLIRLPELKRVHVTVHKGLDSEQRTKANLEKFEENLLEQYRLLKKDRRIEREALKIKPLIQSSQKESENILEILKSNMLSSWLKVDQTDLDKRAARREATEDTVVPPEIETNIIGLGDSGNRFSGEHNSHNFEADSRIHPGFDVATWFGLNLYNMAEKKRAPPFVRVALLDDGVDPAYKNVGNYLSHNGFPPNSPEDEWEPFYTSTADHGSKMAWIISKICPFVEIYVAKIDSHNNSGLRLTECAFSPEQSAAAVEWAIDSEVDIISMSGSFKVTTDKVNDTAQKLTKLLGDPECKPIMYCAARDTRLNDPDDIRYYPAECAQSRKIGAATFLCHAQQYVTKEKTDYIFPSDYVLEDPKDGGNSVATAVAAGVAALVLYCFKKHNVHLDRFKPRFTTSELMHELFKKLKDDESGYVNLTKLFEIDGRTNVSSTKLVNEVIRLLGLKRVGRAGRNDMDESGTSGGFSPKTPSRSMSLKPWAL